MHCEACFGMGVVLRRAFPSGELTPRPCTACGGSGIAHCCEGERPDTRSGLRAVTQTQIGQDGGTGQCDSPAAARSREHTSSADCWCEPVEDPLAPGLWIHNRVQ